MKRLIGMVAGSLVALAAAACSGGPNSSATAPPTAGTSSVSPETARRLGLPVPFSNATALAPLRPTLLVPLYASLGAQWTTLIAEKTAHPTAAIIAIVNPNNGPGTSPSASYAASIAKLSAAGIGVYGYVYTTYGTRPLADVEADVDHYAAWYAPTGLFIDNVANTSGFESYYVTLRAYAHARGITLTIGNPGTPIPASYASAADALVVYEAAGWPPTGALANAATGTNEAFIALGVAYDAAKLAAATSLAPYFYITDKNEATAYETLPSYLDTLASYVSR